MGSETRVKPRRITYTRPHLYPKQLQAIFEPKDMLGADARFSWIEASTKAGKTVGCIAWIYEQAYLFGAPNRNWWWVAPVYNQAEIAFRRLKAYLPKDQFTANEGKLFITLPNGGRIWFKGADKPDSLYGEDVYGCVIDEGSRCKEEAYHAVRSTLTATRGPLRVIGNVKGRKNWFYKNARRAEAGLANHAYYRITAADAVAAGVLDKDEIEGAEADLPANVFRELYNAEASDDEGNPFGIAYLDKIKKPLSRLPVMNWGIDLAKKRDWTVIIGLDKNGQIAFFERFRKDWEATTDHIIQLVGMAPALIDATGVGDPIVERVQKRCPKAEGYIFTQRSKQRLMEGLAVAIQRGETSVLDENLEGNIHYLELESFEYTYTRTGVQYCLAPETRVLKRDLTWVPIREIRTGDKLVGFDENTISGNKTRRWSDSRVLGVRRIMQPCYELKFDDGTDVIASADHRWLCEAGGIGVHWRATQDLKGIHAWSKSKNMSPTRVIRLLNVWETANTYEAGYLAGVFDGEGCISQLKKTDWHNGHSARIGFAQKENALAVFARAALRNLDFSWVERVANTDVIGFDLRGKRQEFLRLLGQIRPKRLLGKFDLNKLGVCERIGYATVQSSKFIGQHPVIALQTSTRTFVAEGLASHNCAPEGMTDDTVMAHGLAVQRKSQGSDLSVWEKLAA